MFSLFKKRETKKLPDHSKSFVYLKFQHAEILNHVHRLIIAIDEKKVVPTLAHIEEIKRLLEISMERSGRQ